MNKHNQDGAVSGVAISLILTVVLLIGAIGFGAWAYTSRQDYKDNSDAKAAAAVEVAVKQESATKDKQFAEEAKQPLKTYRGPDAFGSILLAYPKTWSGYVDDTGKGNNLLDGYFAPGVVPSATDDNSVFAVRVSVVNKTYSDVLDDFGPQQQAGKLNVSAYSLPKLKKVVGVKVVGQLQDQSSVTMIVLPLRSQTLELWTEGTQYLNDFNNNILPNFSFSP